jgi:hypothetical protein
MVGRDQRCVGEERRAANGQCEAEKLSPGNREKSQSISGPYPTELRGLQGSCPSG